MRHTTPGTPATSAANALPAWTVLLVDDDPSVRRVTGRVLRGIGIEVLEAEDGLEALDRLRAHPRPVHLVITDVVMPRMDGAGLAYALAHLHPGLPVLFITAFAGMRLERAGTQPPRIIEKPFDIGQFVATTLAILTESAPPADSASAPAPGFRAEA
jgi:CheY-like chemotaxis protein